MRRVSRNDMIFMAVLVVIAAAVFVFFSATGKESGAYVLVTIDGETYGTYSLKTEQEIPITQDGVTTHVLVIRDGFADMTEADCPDKFCVHQRAISKNNETIVCLPNRVVVQVMGSEESGFDSIAK